VESLPPQGEAPAVDATAVAQKEAKNYGAVVLVLLVLGVVAYGAWYAGVFHAPETPPHTPPAVST
jgi:hypothetical protein